MQVNKDPSEVLRHRDQNNMGASWIIGLGDYEGGEFIDDKERVIYIRNKAYFFDGREPHSASPWKPVGKLGHRFTLILFGHKSALAPELSQEIKDVLAHIGIPFFGHGGPAIGCPHAEHPKVSSSPSDVSKSILVVL